MGSNAQGEALSTEAKALKEISKGLLALDGMGLVELRAQHQELFGEPPRSKNLPYLRKKLAFRIQERIEGGLSPLAQSRLEELAPVSLPVKSAQAVRVVHKPAAVASAAPRDPRLPQVGTLLVREYGVLAHEVEVLETGFKYAGRNYGSLSAIAKEITGTAWNGFLFFGLTTKPVKHGR